MQPHRLPARSLAAAVAVLSAATLAGCGTRTHRTTATGSPTSAPATGSRTPEPSAPPVTGATPAPPPSFAPATTSGARQPVRVAGGSDLPRDDKALIGLVYDAYLADLSGLLDYLSRDWFQAIQEVTTDKMAGVALGAAGAVQRSHDHGIGTLVDSRRVITVKGSSATITSCLDELHWYVVEDTSGKSDPSVARGYFVGTATLVRVQEQWKVSQWNSNPKRCTP